MTTSIPQEQTKNASATATTKAPVAKRRPHTAPLKAKPARKAAHAKTPAPARSGTKTAKILKLLKQPGGVTLKELTKATGWQPHSVRGFLTAVVRNKLGLTLESEKSGEERVYRIVAGGQKSKGKSGRKAA